MPLNETSAAMLAYMTANMPDMAGLTPQEFRAYSAQMVQPADPEDRVSTQEIDAGGVPARIYRRQEATGPEPVLVFYHGGGYIACGLDSHERLCHRLARLGECAVVSVDYRLAPEHVFPAAVDDALAAARWVAAHGADHGLDTERMALGGDSAGATLATVVAARIRDEGGPRIVHHILIYPGADMVTEFPSSREFGDGYFLDADFTELCLTAYLPNADDRAHPWASPARAKDLSNLPPATIMTAECDPLRDEGHTYADRLRASGVPVEYIEYPGVFHGFVSMFGTLAEADEAVGKAAEVLRDVFARSDVA
ncbi:lipase [Croceicoccus estronivorus]|uniref:alpha/beta hydrolase n=1 Tax=Croceicoccus estronivorus TaxID=1172626 RepID=UPI00082A4321|nr:alpha/beta hydrolase [Croceicoccus estronivorus]OCC24374.1 lipase [Croceicoccus estronivorus]